MPETGHYVTVFDCLYHITDTVVSQYEGTKTKLFSSWERTKYTYPRRRVPYFPPFSDFYSDSLTERTLHHEWIMTLHSVTEWTGRWRKNIRLQYITQISDDINCEHMKWQKRITQKRSEYVRLLQADLRTDNSRRRCIHLCKQDFPAGGLIDARKWSVALLTYLSLKSIFSCSLFYRVA